jgi:hypothetical protein
MTVQAVFRSNDWNVISTHNGWKMGRDKFLEFVDELDAEYDRDPLFTRAAATGNKVVGFAARDEDRETPPEGLRYDKTHRFLVPNKSTTTGKKIAKRFQENINPRPTYPGMPEMTMGGGDAGVQVFYPGFEEIDGWLYATWGCDRNTVADYDATLWEPVRLSEWYRLKEERAEA